MSRIKFRLPTAVIATLVGTAALSAPAQAAPIGAYTTKGAWSFVSAPKLHPPKLTTTTKTQRGLASGYFMTGVFKNLTINKPMIGQSGPLILDRNLQPVWFNPINVNALAANVRVQTYNGKPVLSWWQGAVSGTGATTSGEDVV
ncbi:MAG: hypothetical protein JO243_00445, partial [Solirubrobacterales bacterium]|nr:hypothetical protein [Solirubrobacterales bacterium]